MFDSFLTTCFASFKLIKTMDFEGAPIDYIPEEVGNQFHLKYLSLRDMKVKKLPKSIGKLKNLETLNLKRSLVSELPVEISGLSKLRYLAAYIENNDIEYNIDFRGVLKIHSGIRCLQSLQSQNNVNPHLESITSSQTRSILILGVDELSNSFLTTCFASFKLMKTMDFEGAPIDYIPKEVGNQFHLKYLSLRDTEVKKLPKSIGKLKNLETLNLKRSLVS